MATFIDVHNEEDDVTPRGLKEVYRRVLPLDGVDFIDVWADPGTGTVFCLTEATHEAAVQRLHDRAGHPVQRVHEAAFV